MFFQLDELLRWLGLTVFEIWIALVCFIAFTVLLTLKVEGIFGESDPNLIEPKIDQSNHDLLSTDSRSNVSWWIVFSPLFISDALNAYFCVIVFIRMCLEVRFLCNFLAKRFLKIYIVSSQQFLNIY